MKIKAFAFDMDGTLLLPDSSGPHPETMKALKEAHEAGYKIILATGRPIYQTKATASSIGFVSYIVGNNGASLYNLKAEKNISTNFLTEELFQTMVKIGEETKSFFVMSTTENVYKLNFYDGTNVPEWVTMSVNDFGEPDKREDVEKAARTEKITQLTIKNDKELILEKHTELKAKWNEKVSMHIANEVYLDVNPLGASKLTGIETVLKNDGIDVSEVMTFGDSGNDIQMIEGAGYGIAMSNATEGAKAVADEIIGHHSTDTIAVKLREVIKSQSK
ncbi:HAD family hydrolase [Mycoplasma todarodis]|uniref:Cof-type HAD-IIB family hydrolase n=1 Tax=Mycoplasma todarodis TaxID=1937191 RepID=A0A4R0XSY4_9MOLU|nr:HAD family hydrolase [Mycoplasma todarodis]TCG10719.1 hypothetical protein C4B25_03185 [Mycoplasma todarodis]